MFQFYSLDYSFREFHFLLCFTILSFFKAILYYQVICFYSFYEFMILVASRFMANGNYGKLLGTFENDDEGTKKIGCPVLENILFDWHYMEMCT